MEKINANFNWKRGPSSGPFWCPWCGGRERSKRWGLYIFALLSWSQYLSNTLKELFGITWLKGQHHCDTTLVIKTLLICIRSHASSTSSLVRLRDQTTGVAPCAEAVYQLLHIWMWADMDRAADWALSRGTETGSRECFKCVQCKSEVAVSKFNG